MRTIVGSLIALSLVAAVAAPAYALDAKTFYEQQERQSGGSNNAADSKIFWEQSERALP
jgi:hypothetical protein